MSLLAISDLHVRHGENREIVEGLRPASEEDWLLVAGDVGEHTTDIVWAMTVVRDRFSVVVWVPGNHELWTPPNPADRPAPHPARPHPGRTRVNTVTPADGLLTRLTCRGNRRGTVHRPPHVELYPQEAEVVARAVDKRRREFTTARLCARTALGRLDVAPGPILPGDKRAGPTASSAASPTATATAPP